MARTKTAHPRGIPKRARARPLVFDGMDPITLLHFKQHVADRKEYEARKNISQRSERENQELRDRYPGLPTLVPDMRLPPHLRKEPKLSDGDIEMIDGDSALPSAYSQPESGVRDDPELASSKPWSTPERDLSPPHISEIDDEVYYRSVIGVPSNVQHDQSYDDEAEDMEVDSRSLSSNYIEEAESVENDEDGSDVSLSDGEEEEGDDEDYVEDMEDITNSPAADHVDNFNETSEAFNNEEGDEAGSFAGESKSWDNAVVRANSNSPAPISTNVSTPVNTADTTPMNTSIPDANNTTGISTANTEVSESVKTSTAIQINAQFPAIITESPHAPDIIENASISHSRALTNTDPGLIIGTAANPVLERPTLTIYGLVPTTSGAVSTNATVTSAPAINAPSASANVDSTSVQPSALFSMNFGTTADLLSTATNPVSCAAPTWTVINPGTTTGTASTNHSIPAGALHYSIPFKRNQPVPLGVALPNQETFTILRWEVYTYGLNNGFDWNDQRWISRANIWRSRKLRMAMEQESVTGMTAAEAAMGVKTCRMS